MKTYSLKVNIDRSGEQMDVALEQTNVALTKENVNSAKLALGENFGDGSGIPADTNVSVEAEIVREDGSIAASIKASFTRAELEEFIATVSDQPSSEDTTEAGGGTPIYVPDPSETPSKD